MIDAFDAFLIHVRLMDAFEQSFGIIPLLSQNGGEVGLGWIGASSCLIGEKRAE